LPWPVQSPSAARVVRRRPRPAEDRGCDLPGNHHRPDNSAEHATFIVTRVDGALTTERWSRGPPRRTEWPYEPKIARRSARPRGRLASRSCTADPQEEVGQVAPVTVFLAESRA
jgi:hypothetical protein